MMLLCHQVKGFWGRQGDTFDRKGSFHSESVSETLCCILYTGQWRKCGDEAIQQEQQPLELTNWAFSDRTIDQINRRGFWIIRISTGTQYLIRNLRTRLSWLCVGACVHTGRDSDLLNSTSYIVLCTYVRLWNGVFRSSSCSCMLHGGWISSV